ncbi:MAG: hypothetical protein IPM82_22250 [Saprospiraceae bacterium]|nr:hypothetical protein [Saprospiraceae bacterium]
MKFVTTASTTMATAWPIVPIPIVVALRSQCGRQCNNLYGRQFYPQCHRLRRETSPYTFAWNNSLGNGASKTVTPGTTTTYIVTITTATGCTSTGQATVTVVANPSITTQPVSKNICIGTSHTLSVATTGGTPSLTYQWQSSLTNLVFTNISGATSSTYTTPALLVNTYYRVVVSASSNGCVSVTSSTAAVTVQTCIEICNNGTDDDLDGLVDCADSNCGGIPLLNAGADATICSGSSTTLSASATGGTAPLVYTWSNSLGTGATKTVSPTSTTTYTVTVTSLSGCSATDQMAVTVNPRPTANAGVDVTICNTFSTNLTASASGASSPYTYAWSNGLGSGATKTVSPSSTTTYTVTVTSNNGCNNTDQVVVTVQNCVENCGNGIDDDGDGKTDCADADCKPVPDAGSDVSICPGTTAYLNVGVSGGTGPFTYAWSNGLGSGATKTVSPSATTTYSVTVTGASGCTGVDQVKVTILNCTENCTNGVDDDGDGLVDCDDPDCAGVTAPVLVNDEYTTCPGMTYTNRVSYNDGNLNNPLFSITSNPVHGSVTIDWTGKFVYVPNSFECTTDVFAYQVCNQSSGCCDQATVTIILGDNTPPLLTNVPADLTLSCDDEIPSPPIVTSFDNCPGLFIEFDETSSQNYVGACGSYTITRTWTATDFCGNVATDNQVITILDQTKPEIFQVYTLENGSKLAAGVAQRVTHDWKYIRFPITFKSTPVVLAQVATNSDGAAITAYLRNVSMQGFEVRVKEEELADGQHGIENVAWIAVDPGTGTGDLKWEASTFANVSHQLDTINFALDYTEAPIFLSSMMTTRQTDPATLRHNALTVQSVEIFAQEEASVDVEVDRLNETVGFMAIEPNMELVDELGEVFGETGKLKLTNAWATVNLTRNYTKPVVIVGSLTNQDGQPVTVRVRNIANNKFQARLQEWDYLDGNHDAENVSWMVVEGSIPGDAGYYCSGQAVNLKPNINIFVVDNCDDLVSFGFTESSSQGITGLTTTRTWTGIDDCGNTTLVSRYDTCVVAAVQLKAMLYGAIFGNGGSSTMRDNLREQDFMPLEEPYSALPGFPNIDYEIIDPNEDLGNGNPTEEMVTVCHKYGTSGEATLSVPLSEVAYYLSIGDYVGDCASNSTGMVTICHKPGTSEQMTLNVSLLALLSHLAHGDVIGACSGSGNDLSNGAANAQYQTIADGNWTDAATWQGGLIPPTSNINNKTISIKHNVTVQNDDIKLKDNSKLYVTGGSLTLNDKDFEIEKSEAYFERSVLDMSAAKTVKLKKNESVLRFKDCTVTIGQNLLVDEGKLKMENVNLTVGDDFKLKKGIDSLINVCGTIGKDFDIDSDATLFIQNSSIRMPQGKFRNKGLVAGSDITFLVENSDLLNDGGTWTASVAQYCVSGTVTLPTALLPAVEDCNNISNLFTPCDCYESEGGTSNSGSGIAEVVSTVSNVLMNPGKSLGDGKIEAGMLEITGEEAAVDWMLVELRGLDNAGEVLGYSTVILQRDGDVVNEDGDSVIVFPGLNDGDYYVSIRHRNHLGIMTNAPVNLTINDPLLVDFSDPNFPVKGGSLAGRSVNGKRTMWGGDFNEDGKIIYQGPYNDVFYLFSRVLADENNMTNLANFIVPGYDSHDFNLDGLVIYQGPYNDRGLLLFNSILAHTGNGSLLANYIVLDLIP